MGAAHLCLKMGLNRPCTCRTQTGCAFLDQAPIGLGHPGCWRTGAWRIGKHVQPCQMAAVHQCQRVFKSGLGLGRETGDNISPKSDTWPCGAGLFAKPNGIARQMPTFHPLQDQIVTMLEAEMKMRHQARLCCNRVHERIIDFDGIDRTDPQTRHIRQPQNAAHQIPKRRCPGKIRAPGGQIDPGQHDFLIPALHQPVHLIHNHPRRHRARIAPTVRDDAEGAAVIAAVLHLNIGARARAEPVDQMPGRLRDGHDVIHLHGLCRPDQIWRHGGPGFGLHLLGIADNAIDFFHRSKAVGIGLGGTPRHDQRGVRVLPAQLADILARLAHSL